MFFFFFPSPGLLLESPPQTSTLVTCAAACLVLQWLESALLWAETQQSSWKHSAKPVAVLGFAISPPPLFFFSSVNIMIRVYFLLWATFLLSHVDKNFVWAPLSPGLLSFSPGASPPQSQAKKIPLQTQQALEQADHSGTCFWTLQCHLCAQAKSFHCTGLGFWVLLAWNCKDVQD